ncbi:hypothetical protein ACWOAH_01850 [Vagococcus vulneris]|uniref:Uncharacterized protein n=1 Tax=Vagococcus vulneris TaxID=1977869 RepID=A0A430A1B3_9ENTE|nr:hypothetical protein [Vagococcus vulneris]RSU00186.1 hypothetical protein CBF37_02495 [Vagococcus vulneris]
MMQDTTIKLRDQLMHYTSVIKGATNLDNLKSNGVVMKPNKHPFLRDLKSNTRKWHSKLY